MKRIGKAYCTSANRIVPGNQLGIYESRELVLKALREHYAVVPREQTFDFKEWGIYAEDYPELEFEARFIGLVTGDIIFTDDQNLPREARGLERFLDKLDLKTLFKSASSS